MNSIDAGVRVQRVVINYPQPLVDPKAQLMRFKEYAANLGVDVRYVTERPQDAYTARFLDNVFLRNMGVPVYTQTIIVVPSGMETGYLDDSPRPKTYTCHIPGEEGQVVKLNEISVVVDRAGNFTGMGYFIVPNAELNTALDEIKECGWCWSRYGDRLVRPVPHSGICSNCLSAAMADRQPPEHLWYRLKLTSLSATEAPVLTEAETQWIMLGLTEATWQWKENQKERALYQLKKRRDNFMADLAEDAKGYGINIDEHPDIFK